MVEHMRPAGPAGVHDLLAQPGRGAGPLRPRHLRARGARGARRGRRDHAQPAVHLNAACSGGIIAAALLGHLAATDGWTRREPDAAGVRARQRARRDGGRARRTASSAAAAVAESARRGYLDGQALAGVFTWLRPNDLVWSYVVNNYLLGKDAAGVRRPLLEPGHGPAGRRPAPRLRPARARELARAAGRARGARHAGRPRRGRRRQLRRRRAQRPHHPVGERVPERRSCSAARRGSCCPRAATSRRSSTRRARRAGPATASRDELPGGPAGWLEQAADPARAAGGPTTSTGCRALGRAQGGSAKLGSRKHKPGAKAPGSYVHAS